MGPINSDVHVQSVMESEPLTENDPGGQDTHESSVLAAVVGEYVEVGHSTHAAVPSTSL